MTDKMDTVLVGDSAAHQSVGAGAGAAGTAVTDWLRSARKTWDALTRALASTRFSSAFFASLPSIYMIGLIIYINVQFAKDLAACVDAAYRAASPNGSSPQKTSAYLFSPILSPFNTFIGSLLGVSLAASLASILAIWKKWPGVLSFWTWTVEVLKDWFIVTFIILLFSWASAFSTAQTYAFNDQNVAILSTMSTCTLNIMVSMMLPAIFVWQISASVTTRQRMIFSGE
jgi:hypothetical protein